MGMSRHLEELRNELGHRLLLLPSVGALIWDNSGRLLLQRRTDDNRWGLPGGGIDPGETPAQAVVRETREETGLQIIPQRVAGIFGGIPFRHRYPNGDEVESTEVVFDCTIVGGALREQKGETAALQFFEPAIAAERLLQYPGELFTDRTWREALFTPGPVSQR